MHDDITLRSRIEKRLSFVRNQNLICIARDDEIGITNLAQYSIRSLFRTGKLYYNESIGMVTCRFNVIYDKNKKNFSICTAENVKMSYNKAKSALRSLIGELGIALYKASSKRCKKLANAGLRQRH